MRNGSLIGLALIIAAAMMWFKHGRRPVVRTEVPRATASNTATPEVQESMFQKPPIHQRQTARQPDRETVQFENTGLSPLSQEERVDRVARYYASPEYIKGLLDREEEFKKAPLTAENLVKETVDGPLTEKTYKTESGTTIEIMETSDVYFEEVTDDKGRRQLSRQYRNGKLSAFLAREPYIEPGDDGHPDLYYRGVAVEQYLQLNPDGSVNTLVSNIGKKSIKQTFVNGKVVERIQTKTDEDGEDYVENF